MRTDPVPILMEMFKFLLDKPNLVDTVIEKRIVERCGAQNLPKAMYKLKSLDNNLNRNVDMYSPE